MQLNLFSYKKLTSEQFSTEHSHSAKSKSTSNSKRPSQTLLIVIMLFHLIFPEVDMERRHIKTTLRNHGELYDIL